MSSRGRGRKGAPGLAWNDVAVTVRILRGDRAEVFALNMQNGTKLGGFRLAPNHGQCGLGLPHGIEREGVDRLQAARPLGRKINGELAVGAGRLAVSARVAQVHHGQRVEHRVPRVAGGEPLMR